MEADGPSGSLLWISCWGFWAWHNGSNLENEPIDSTEKLVGAVGEVDESVTAEHLSDVEWRDDDPLFMFNGENVMKPQAPATALTPVQTWEEEDKAASLLESLLGKKPCF